MLAITTAREEGGAEWYLRTVLGAARSRGWNVSLAMPRHAQTACLRDHLARDGVAVHALPVGKPTTSRMGAYAAIVIDLIALLWIILRVRPDAILLILTSPEATPGAMLACALARVPTTAVFQLVQSDLRTTPRRRRLYQLAAPGPQHWVCVSEDNRATLASTFGVSSGRIAVIPNGVALRTVTPDSREAIRAELQIAPETTLVLTTGRLAEQKGHRVIVDALPRLIGLGAPLAFVWAGDGPLREYLTAAVQASGLGDHLQILGQRDDVPELLAAADLFLLPSRDEGASFALVEAMLAGVPAIVSDAGALTEIIEDHRNGLVFARGDVDGLVRVVDWTLAHREEMARMAVQAREQALREFTVERMIDGLMALLDPVSF
jgi:glycosyltransferase involved in cell wall biosynthesis